MEFVIKNQKLTIDTPLIVAETKKYLTATFTFSDDWEGITERVLHYDNGINVYDKTIGLNGITESDDWQLTEGTWKLYIHGIDGNGRRITTSSVYISVEPFGRFDGEMYPTTPQHVIDELLLLIKTDGDGTIFLADDGTYKGVTVSSQEIAEAVESYLETHPVAAEWGNISGSLENQTDLAEVIANINDAISSIVVPSALSQLLDDSEHRTVTDAEKTAWNNKQNALVSGTNIKTINGESVLGSGNIEISGGGGAFDKFAQNIDVDYEYDSASNANYTVIRVYKNKLDGTKQFPFVYAPNGAGACEKTSLEIAEEDGFFLVANAGVFDTATHKADGQLVENSVVLKNSSTVSHSQCRPLVIDENGDLSEALYDADANTLVSNGAVSVVCGFMAIIKNFEKVPQSEWNSVSHYTQNTQRQIIGQFGNGDYAIVTCEGRNAENSDGWTIAEAQDVCAKLGLKFAYNLDGGGSTETCIGKKMLNHVYEGTSGRKVPTFIVFNGKTTFDIEPTPGQKVLSSISATKTKTSYYTDETFSTADVTVTATYDDSSTANVTLSANIGTVDITTAGAKTLSISYTEDGVTKTTTISISVSERPTVKTLSSISAAKTKTSYEVGETFSTSDVVVTAHYSDSTTATVTTSATIGTVDTSTSGNKTLNISYSEDGVTKTTTIAITVNETSGELDNLVRIPRYALTSFSSGNVTVSGNYQRATILTSVENGAPVMNGSDVTGYLLSIPDGATSFNVTCSELIAGLSVFNSSLARVIDAGWGTVGGGTQAVDKTQGHAYVGMSFKKPDNSNFDSPDALVDAITVSFT